LVFCGTRHDRYKNIAIQPLLEQPEPKQAAPEDKPTTSPHKQPKRKPLPKRLPREVVVHDMPEEDKVCACYNGALHKMGEDKSEKLEFIIRHIPVAPRITASSG
jgi:transposase